MVVKQSSIDWFVSGRDLPDFTAFKKVKPELLDSKLAAMTPAPRFVTPPFHHQKIGYWIGMTNENFLYFFDMGTGKTKTILDVIENRGRPRTLVLVPNTANVYGWMEEVERHQPGIRAVPLLGTSLQKWKASKQSGDVYITTYVGLVAMVKHRQDGKSIIDPKKVDELPDFDCLVLDESTCVKNPQSLSYKACNLLSLKAKLRYALTGTPFGRDPHDLWGQFYLIDRGETLGYTLSFYRSCFFSTKLNRWGGRDYTFKRQMDSSLHRLLRSRSLFVSESECQDLPPTSWQTLRFDLPKSTKSYYNQIIQRVIRAEGSLPDMEGCFVKSRQITSGFIYLEDDDGNRQEVVFPENPKLDILVDLISCVPRNAKVLVFHEFLKTCDTISDKLNKEGIGWGAVNSKVSDPASVISRFKSDDRVRVLLLNNQSGAFGLNLQVANYCVFYESPVSPIIRSQCEKRLHRTGQTRRVHYYDIVGRGSVDERVLEYIKEGKDLFASIVKGKTNLRSLLIK